MTQPALRADLATCLALAVAACATSCAAEPAPSSSSAPPAPLARTTAPSSSGADAPCAPVVATAPGNEPVFVRDVERAGGTTTTWTLSDVGPGAHAVLRVFRRGGATAPDVEVARTDGAGPLRVDVATPPGSSARYTLVVHGAATAAHGRAVLREDDGAAMSIRFGGVVQRHCGLGARDALHAIFEPGTAGRLRLLVVDAPTGSARAGPLVADDDEATVGAPVGGARDVWSVASSSISSGGAVSVVVNDGTDGDGDGVGDALERALHMCPDTASTTDQGWDCRRFRSADTDVDGLPDAVEVFHATEQGTHFAPRKFGGSPAHKDVFVEVDWGEGEYQAPDDVIAEHYNGALMTSLRDAYATARGTGTAAHVGNPDFEDGLRLHFDVAGAPTLSLPGNPVIRYAAHSNEVPGGCDHRRAYKEQQTAVRRKYVHHLCSSQQTQGGARVLSKRFSAQADAHRIGHELGHNLGLNHGGDEGISGKPNYVSMMSYGCQDYLLGFSRGGAPPLDPLHLVEADGVGDGAASPRLSGPPYSLARTDGGGAGVDWNRDGVVSRAPVSAAVYWTPGFESHARDRRAHRFGFVAPRPSGTPSVARFDDGAQSRVYVLWTGPPGAHVHAMHMQYPDDCATPLAGPDDEDPPCGAWSAPMDLGFAAHAVSATQAVDVDGRGVLVVVAVPAGADDGAVRVLQGAPDADGALRLTTTATLAAATGAGAAPRVVGVDVAQDGAALHVAWVDAAGVVVTAQRDAAGLWTTARPAVDARGAAWTSRTPPVLAIDRVAAVEGGAAVRLLRTREDGALELLAYVPGDGTWTASTTIGGPDTAGVDRPGVAWRAFGPARAPAGPGGWLVVRPRDALNRVLYVHQTGATSSSQVFGLFTSRRNEAMPTTGIDLEFRPDLGDHHVLGAFATPAGELVFYPYADGVLPFVARDHDDVARMSAGVCRSLHPSDGDVCDPLDAGAP